MKRNPRLSRIAAFFVVGLLLCGIALLVRDLSVLLFVGVPGMLMVWGSVVLLVKAEMESPRSFSHAPWFIKDAPIDDPEKRKREKEQKESG